MAKTKQSTSSQASPATPSNAYANFAAGTGPYPNQNVYYNPKSDPTGGYGALSNFDFSPYAGNKGAIKELGQAYGISLSPEQLDLYARNPQSLGSLRAGGTSSYQGGPQQGYGYSGPYGGMAVSGGIPLGTLMMMRGQGQNQAAPPSAPTSSYNSNPTIQLTPQQSGTLTPQVTQQAPSLATAPPIVPQQPISPQPVSQPPANAGNILNPIPVQMQPVQQFQSGGFVTDPNLRLSGGSNQSNQQPTPPNYYGNQYPIYAVNAQGAPTGQPNYANPIGLAGMLGAAALGMPYIQNVTPSGTPSSKSGVAPVGGAMIGTSVPQVTPTWESVGVGGGFSQADIDTFKAQGLTPSQVAQQFGVSTGPLGGPWTTNPSVFAKAAVPKPTAPLALNPITPASAVPYAPGQAFATPPAAPSSIPSALPSTMAQSGATTTTPPAAMLPPGFMGGTQGAGYVPQAFLQAHTSALADAGKALYAHFGGNPNSASPADIANFHTQLTGAVEQHIGANQPAGANPMANPLAGGPPQPIPWQQAWAGQHGLTNPTLGSAAVQLPSGVTPPYAGFAPSSGFNPKPWTGPGNIADAITAASGPMGMSASNTAAALAGLQGAPLKKAAAGGIVPGRGNEDTVPALLTPGEYVIPKHQVAQLAARGVLRLNSGGTVQDPDPDPPEARRQALTVQSGSAPAGNQPSSAQSSSLQVPGGRSLVSGLSRAAQTYGNAFSSIGTNAYQAPAGSSAMTVGQLGSGPMPGAGQTMSLGQLPATSGLSSTGAQSALGGVASGLNQAAQAIASSAQPWQIQQSAIPDPSQLPKYQIPTLQPVRVT